MLNYAKFVWNNIPGPKISVLIMSVLVGLANGAMLSAINNAISARVDGTFGWTYPAVFVAAVLAFFFGGYFAMFRATDMAERFVELLRKRIVDQAGLSSLREVEEYGRGEIYVHLTRDTSTVGMASIRLVHALQSGVVVFFCLAYLLWLSPMVFLVTLVLVATGVKLFFMQERHAQVYLNEARAQEAALFSGISDMLDGFKETKLSQSVARDLNASLNQSSAKARENFVKAEFLFYSTTIVSKFMLFSLLGLIAFLPEQWIGATSALAFQILALLLYLVPPLEQLVDLTGPYMRAQVSLQNLQKLEGKLAEEVVGREVALAEDGALQLHQVELDYRDAEIGTTFTLGPLDLRIEPGEIVFLVGGNGSGKTTLMKVLAGLYAPDRGRVSVGNVELSPDNRGAWRDRVASVFHDFHLFDQAFGLDAESAQPLIQAELDKVGLSDKVTIGADGGFSTTRLSTGQRKRLALVLARAQRRPVLLMDEFGAEQDPEFRAFFYTDYLEALRAEGVTVIAVTHDDRYFGTCDRLIKLDLGRIISDGPPVEGVDDGFALREATRG
ncbi:cyclic peptide export ABC transporter [Pseudooceanicola sp.]|uniref:cyclic peptide export ABC transporter n=1 Tax=Pseudooceanicola sp. TaxID=1914328 RepID=UPI00263141E0|nr:cyclic peptide export ABC transporter [Pseudooceanicola sp.]MDF1856036.1 cyclic peptide export ABC transporter [Pseudooceanicola sp.]